MNRREIFSPDAKRRAARFMAERGTAVRRPNGRNGHGRTLVLDPGKLARFEPASWSEPATGVAGSARPAPPSLPGRIEARPEGAA